jgi:hypothetical protein
MDDTREKPAVDISTATFTHRARGEFTWEPTRTYVQGRPWAKPNGFWLSVDHDWERWLDGEEMASDPDWGVVTTRFDVDTTRLLHLASADDIDQFDRSYVEFMGKPDRYRIDWAPLAERFAGIVIAPYIWERRLDGDASTWYYPWDCASACVWDLSVVEPRVIAQRAVENSHA